MTVTSLAGADHVALGDRLRYLLALRVAIAVTTVAFAAATTASLGVPLETLAGLSVCYLAVALVFEWIGQQVPGASFASLTVMLLVDGVFLAAAVYATGGTESPLRFLVYIHLVAVSLLASYRTGLKIALWHSLLVLVVLYAQAAAILQPVDVQPGAPTIGSVPVISVTAFWLFALATSLFSALNERELRQRREDLESLVAMGTRLDDEGDPFQQASFVLDGLADRYAFPGASSWASSTTGWSSWAASGCQTLPCGPWLRWIRSWSGHGRPGRRSRCAGWTPRPTRRSARCCRTAGASSSPRWWPTADPWGPSCSSIRGRRPAWSGASWASWHRPPAWPR